MEVLPFSTGETEVVAQPIFIVDNGVVRPLGAEDANVPTADAVQITTQLERDHEMALALSESTPSEQVIISENYNDMHSSLMVPMDIETQRPARRETTHTTHESGYEPLQEPFDELEYIASSRIRQCLTTSTAIVVAEFIVLVAMCAVEGLEDTSINPMIGPPIKVFIRFQAKQASLMKYEHEWLRSLFAIFLHSGFLHIVPLMAIQLRVGGYLNLIFGTPVFLGIFLISGVFANLVSCIADPDSVGLGSQGALMGLIAAWMTYVGFRWKYVNNSFDRFVNARNRQIGVAAICVGVLLVVAFEPFVDFLGLFAGGLQGLCWGSVYFCKTLNHKKKKRRIRVAAISMSIILYAAIIYYLVEMFKPPVSLVSYYDSGDDDFNI